MKLYYVDTGTIETDFEPILNKLDHDKFTAICWDPPGYGKSRPPERDIVYSRNDGNPFVNDAEYAAELMKVLEITLLLQIYRHFDELFSSFIY